MDFGSALNALKGGHAVCRAGWNGKGMWLEMVDLDGHHATHDPHNGGVKTTVPWAPFIGMVTADRKMVPWLASQTDILANDWELM